MKRVPWLAAGLVGCVLALLACAWIVEPVVALLPACPFKSFFGIPCLTCGLTRCVLALAHGQLRGAFHWHPVAVSLLLLSPLAILWDLRRAWMGRDFPPLPDSLRWRLGVAALLAGTWLLQILRGI